MKRPSLLYPAPVLLLLVAVLVPVVRGGRFFFLRDVLNAHFEMKVAEAEGLRSGYVPEIDPYRAGGQPLAGNPNAVPFYPDNLLYLTASPFWAISAHFWLHLLLAPFAAYWLGRAWGLSRQGSWAAGVAYAFSGFFLSNLSFYNLVAGVALAPALVAAVMTAAAGRRWAVPVAGLLWALILLAGDPLMAVLALFLAATALVARGDLRRWRALLPLALALVAGTLVALPQLVEFLRILPLSYRGYRRYTEGVGGVASFDPRSVLEWLLPFAFGRPELLTGGRFWGKAFYTGFPPYYFSLYPGLLALCLVPAAGRPRRGPSLWGWGVAAVGLFFALGRFNPLAGWLLEALGGGLLRYPIKFWLPVAVGLALVAGLGFERVFVDGRRRRLALPLAASAILFALFWAVFTLLPGVARGLLGGLVPVSFGGAFVENERLRWAGLAFLSLVLLALLALALRLARSRPYLAGAVLLALHAGSQLFLLRPLLATDDVRPYRRPSPVLALVPPGSRVVQGAYLGFFGPSTLAEGTYPTPHVRWIARRSFFDLYPSTGALWRRRYELDPSPEGLDSYLTRIARLAVEKAEDPVRVRLLRVWGVDRLLLDRPLAPGTAGVSLLGTFPSFGQTLYVYAIDDPAPPIRFVGREVPAPDMTTAVRALADPAFDPHTTVVVPGDGPVREGPGGRVEVTSEGPEAVDVVVEAGSAGVLVLERAYLPLYRATIDGAEAPLVVADVHRLGVEVPAGRHRVRVAIDRRPLRLATAAAGAGALLLVGLWVAGRRRARGDGGTPEG